ncbi:MAG: peptidoglycan-binding domain-containing protein [Synechococcales cyanobacterium]
MDGTYGSQTETAIRNFQAGIGLPPTGLLDPETQSSLDRSLADG